MKSCVVSYFNLQCVNLLFAFSRFIDWLQNNDVMTLRIQMVSMLSLCSKLETVEVLRLYIHRKQPMNNCLGFDICCADRLQYFKAATFDEWEQLQIQKERPLTWSLCIIIASRRTRTDLLASMSNILAHHVSHPINSSWLVLWWW